MPRALLAVLILPLLTSVAVADDLSYVDIVNQLTDLDRLTTLQTGVKGGQYSSYARQEHEQWAFNADAGQYIRVEENGEAVMMEQDGPGCIYRIWSANPQGKLHIYLDHATEPSLVLDFNGVFTGENPPFTGALVYKRGERQSASDCYVPISFSEHIKVCADENRPQFYIFNYLQYPDDWTVENFHLPLTDAEEAALQRARDAWAAAGADPKPTLPKQKERSRKITLEPGRTVTLADLTGPGTVRALRMRVSSEQRDVWRKLILRGTWDGAEWAQVLTPVGAFFGFDWEMPDYAAVPAGCVDGQCYFYFPMPFRDSGRLELISHLELPAEVEYEVEWAPADLPEDMAYFFARWRHEIDSTSLDYPFIETAGQGHLVGITLQIDHPIPGWWGEGDEKVWIDGDQFPEWIGTGSEDYFGDAWGIRYLPGGSWGCSLDKYPKTCPYRWHFMDMIPFERRLRMTIENYGSWGSLDADEFEYNSVAYWYQKELTPPFEKLVGKTYIGGEEYQQTPAEYEYQPDRFTDITEADTRTSGLDIPFAVEIEDLVEAADLITDAKLPYQLNWEQAVDFGRVAEGDVLAEVHLAVPEEGVYYPTVYTTPEEGAAEVTLQLDGDPLAVIARPEPHKGEIDGILMPEGGAAARLVAATSGRAVVDCLQLLPAPSQSQAIEAEKLEIVSAQGPAPRPSTPLRGASAGRFLDWSASEGASATLRVPTEEGRSYVLGVRPLQGPESGIIQAFADGESIGPQFDLYAPERKPWMLLPLGLMPTDTDEVQLRVVGKNAQSAGYRADLDYFRWEPLIIHPDSAEGVWGRVARNERCGYRPQPLGPAFVGGHHFWVQPCNHTGYVEFALHLPEAGEYELSTRYTTSWDYAITQATLDGEPVGDLADTCTPEVRQMEPTTLCRKQLTAGLHLLRFTAVDKNPDSKGYLMGIDYVLVERVD